MVVATLIDRAQNQNLVRVHDRGRQESLRLPPAPRRRRHLVAVEAAVRVAVATTDPSHSLVLVLVIAPRVKSGAVRARVIAFGAEAAAAIVIVDELCYMNECVAVTNSIFT